MATYDAHNFRFERHSLWHLIVGHRYVTVKTKNVAYVELLSRLAEDMGEEFHKPVALLSVATLLASEEAALDDLDLVDYEYEVM